MKSLLYRCSRVALMTLFSFLLTGGSQTWAQGLGEAFVNPIGIAVSADRLFVAEEFGDKVLQVDSISGDRTVLLRGNIGSGLVLQQVAGIVSQNNGLMLVADRSLGAILEIDPVTGNRRILSGCPVASDPCAVPLVGTGLPFGNPVALAVADDGSLLVLDVGDVRTALVRVNPVTGARVLVSSLTQGGGPAFSLPVGVTTGGLGDIFVVDQTLDAIVQVDPTTGDRTVVSGCMQEPDPCPSPTVGTGPDFSRPTSVAFRTGQTLTRQNLVVTDAGLGAVIGVNTTSGSRTILSGVDIGFGPVLLDPVAIAVEANGMIVVVDSSRHAIIRVDPSSGDRTIVSKETDLIVSPPTGIYSSVQLLDLALFLSPDGAMSNFNVLLNDNTDVTEAIMTCMSSAPLTGGGMLLSCPDVTSVLNLQPGRHRLRFALRLTVANQGPVEIVRRVTWDLAQ